MWEQKRESQPPTAAEMGERWRRDPVLRSELDTALTGWFHRPAPRHADWLDEANFLAYGLARTGRDADAAPVFASIGKFIDGIPWGWWGELGGDADFVRARRRARRAV
ncbi:hypothetical protein AB0M36_12035 [Actinoplanes sp. NPDC051346]|uniref:hypothetical protein n=1 Tax=Actinoplanes sp. NPDC051346 TaxID=3155048 RepID=UPI0034206939